MLKKMTILAATLMLLLATAQLAVAQQDVGTGQPPVQDEQATAPDTTQQDTGQQAATQTQPAGEAQAAPPNLDGLMRLNENNNLVVDCEDVSGRLAQLEQLGDALASDPQFQSVLAQAETLAQLCASNGFTPPSAGEPSSSNSTGASPEQVSPEQTSPEQTSPQQTSPQQTQQSG